MKNVMQAISKFQDTCPKIKKDAENPFFKSKYAELSGIVNEIHKTLKACELVVIQPVEGLSVKTVVCHTPSGEVIESTYPLNANPDAQKFLASVTYARRGALTAILGIVAEDDDDGNSVADKPVSKPAQTHAKPETKAEGKGGYKQKTPQEWAKHWADKCESVGVKVDLEAMISEHGDKASFKLKEAYEKADKTSKDNAPF